MIKHFYEANRVDLIFASRWTRSDQTLLDIITNLSKLRSNIYLHAINGFEYEYTSFSMIKYYSIDFKKEYGYEYDVIYTKKLKEIFERIF